MYTCGFSVTQMWQFCLFTYPPRSKWASTEKMIFSSSIFVNKNSFNMARKRSPLTVTACPCSFSKKNGPKSAPNNDSFWVRRLFNLYVRFVCALNATILLVYIPAMIKMSFIRKYDFFFGKIVIFCKLITDPPIFVRRKEETDYLSNQTWAKCYHSWNKH